MTLMQLSPTQMALLFSPLIFVFWAIYHAFTHEFQSPNEKYYWVLLCSFVPVIGALIYIIFGIRRIKTSKNNKEIL